MACSHDTPGSGRESDAGSGGQSDGWALVDSGVPSSGEGGSSGIAGEGGVAGEGGITGDGGIAGEGGAGIAGESGSGIAGEGGSGIAGEAGVAAPPVDPASIVLIGVDERPYTECAAFKIGANYARDAEGIPLKLYRDDFTYNPVLIAQAGLEWLACYRESNDAWYLEQARKAGRHLVSKSEDFDGAMFFPYHFDFYLHGRQASVARAPWYSGMAQGQALSLFSRLGELTSDAEWELAAATTLKSFDRARGEAQPWIMDVDEDNSLWIEEYPTVGEAHVLNGFVFAMFGLYDYYAWRGDEHAAELFRQSLHTLRLNVERFRNPLELSAYCLAHRVQNAGYHKIHIWQLGAITRMTDDPYFASVADLFAADYSPAAQADPQPLP